MGEETNYNPFILQSEHKRILASTQERYDNDIRQVRGIGRFEGGLLWGVIGFLTGMLFTAFAVGWLLTAASNV